MALARSLLPLALLAASFAALAAGCPGRSTAGGGAATTPAAGPAGPRVDLDGLLGRAAPATVGLPARSAELVAVTFVHGDGGRGNPSLTLRVLRAADGTLDRELVLLTPDEFETTPEEELRARVSARVEEASRLLAEGGFAPLELVGEAGAPAFDGDPVRLAGAGLVAAVVEGHAVVRREGGPVLLDALVEAPVAEDPDGDDVCAPSRPVVTGAWVDRDRSLVVLRLLRVGPEVCGEPDVEMRLHRLGPGDETHAYGSDHAVDCALFGEAAYRARLVAAGVELDGVECGERADE